jgi:SAM-dependent MidA family methyltransferase
LAAWGRKYGLEVGGFTDQAHFLMSLGLLEVLSSQDTGEALKERLEAKTLLLPGGMGEMFKVLIQYKGLKGVPLTGLKFLPQRKSCHLSDIDTIMEKSAKSGWSGPEK